MFKVDITSITISELSLVLLFVFIIFYAHDSISRTEGPKAEINALKKEISQLKNDISDLNKQISDLKSDKLQSMNKISDLNHELDSLKKENKKLREQLDESQGKRSKQLPSCKEKGLTDEWFAEIEIIGDKYKILKDNNDVQGIDPNRLYSFNEIKKFYEVLVDDHKRTHKCQQSIKIVAAESLNVTALNRLKMLFYVKTTAK